jgi:hypothetical protein
LAMALRQRPHKGLVRLAPVRLDHGGKQLLFLP